MHAQGSADSDYCILTRCGDCNRDVDHVVVYQGVICNVETVVLEGHPPRQAGGGLALREVRDHEDLLPGGTAGTPQQEAGDPKIIRMGSILFRCVVPERAIQTLF